MSTFYSQSWTQMMRSLLDDPSFYHLLSPYDRLSFRNRIISIPREDASLTLCLSALNHCASLFPPDDHLLSALREAKRRILLLQELEKDSP